MTKLEHPRPEPTSTTTLFSNTRADKIFGWAIVGIGSIAIIVILIVAFWIAYDIDALRAFLQQGDLFWWAR